MAREIICTLCQKPIESNPSFEFVRVTKRRFLLFLHVRDRQVFHFHTRSEIVSWLKRAGVSPS